MIRKAWLNDKVRYLLIGAFNTFFGYSVFAALWLLWGQTFHYIVVLAISHIIVVTSAFFCYRIWVFRKKGGIGGDFVRFNMVYLGAFIFNILVLPVLVEGMHFHPLVAQALVVVVTVVASYLLHRRFSFRLGKLEIVSMDGEMGHKLATRSKLGCICCGGMSFKKEYGLVSPFFAERVLEQANSMIVDVLLCKKCKSRFFDVDISDAQLGRLYADYRGDSYFKQRNKHEPWYTKAINDHIGGDEEFAMRRKTCAEALAAAHVRNEFTAALDHGGDRGQMLSAGVINAKRRAVYEISGVALEQDVENVTRQQMCETSWDLILSCHVLEHTTNPSSYVADLVSLGHKGTVYFFEIPNERYISFGFNGMSLQRQWLNWIISHPILLRLFHFLSVGFRTKLKIVPPFLFPALNEHLNFFSVQGLQKLLVAQGLDVKYSGIGSSGHIVAVAIKQ